MKYELSTQLFLKNADSHYDMDVLTKSLFCFKKVQKALSIFFLLLRKQCTSLFKEKYNKNLFVISSTLFLNFFTLQLSAQQHFLDIDFMPNIKQKRISLSDEQNTHSVISSKLSYGFNIDFKYQLWSKESFIKMGLSQNTVRLVETSNASMATEELNYMRARLFYEYHGRFNMFRFGAVYDREYYMLIDNNIVDPQALQNIYGVFGYHIITKAGYKSKAYTGIDYGSLISSSQVAEIDLKSATYFRFSSRFVFNYQTIAYLLEVFYKSSTIEYENIEQNIPELGIGIGLRF